MKSLSIAGLLAGMTLLAPLAHADQEQFHGSDTLSGAVKQAITAAGLDSVLLYLGGGSGTGESGMVAGTQGIAPMSRALTDAAINAMLANNVTPVQNVVGLDGVSLFVNSANTATSLDILTIRAIFTCAITTWDQVPNNGGKTGTIAVYRRDDLSGTTDTFKNLVGVGVTINGVALPSFGSCVTVVPTTEAIADHTSSEDLAIGYAGLSGGVAGNKALPVALTTTSAPVAPNQSTIRDFSYPLARRLYVMNVSGAQIPTDVEQALLDAMLDRAFLDPILEANEFITCPSLADGGCP